MSFGLYRYKRSSKRVPFLRNHRKVVRAVIRMGRTSGGEIRTSSSSEITSLHGPTARSLGTARDIVGIFHAVSV